MLAILPVTVLLCSTVAAGVTLLVDGRAEQTIPSFDFVHTPFKPFNRTGYLVLAELQLNNSTQRCEASLSYPSVDRASTMAFTAYNSSVLMVRHKEASRLCKLQTFSQLWPIVRDFLSKLKEYRLPLCDAIVIGSNRRSPGGVGDVFSEAFAASTPGVSEAPPPDEWNVAFVASKDWERGMRHNLIPLVKDTSRVLAYNVVAEQNAWNVQFDSVGFSVFRWVLFGVCVVVLAGSLYLFAQTTIAVGEFEWNLRNTIFLLDVAGVALYMAVLVIPVFKFASHIVRMTSECLVSMAFMLLLYLWSTLMLRIERSATSTRMMHVFRGVIACSFLVLVADALFGTIMPVTSVNSVLGIVCRAVASTLSAMYVLLAALFVVFSIQFFRKVDQVRISPTTMAALTRLSVLASIAACVYLVIAVNNYLMSNDWISSARKSLWSYMAMLLVATIRSLSLLAVLSVQVPSQGAVPSPATSSVIK